MSELSTGLSGLFLARNTCSWCHQGSHKGEGNERKLAQIWGPWKFEACRRFSQDMLWDVFSNFYWACPRNRLLPYWGWLNLDDMFPERSFLNHQCTIAGHFPPHLLQAVDSLFFSPYFKFFCKCISLYLLSGPLLGAMEYCWTSLQGCRFKYKSCHFLQNCRVALSLHSSILTR